MYLWNATATRGKKFFELGNHLGNVLAVITDHAFGHDGNANGVAEYYRAEVVSANDYFPFGLEMAGRIYQGGEHRYGFNGKENDGDWGNSGLQDYGFRLYSRAIGKFLSVDPLSPEYPWYTPYQFAGNMPISAIDIEGLEVGLKILNSGGVFEPNLRGNSYIDIAESIPSGGSSYNSSQISKIKDYYTQNYKKRYIEGKRQGYDEASTYQDCVSSFCFSQEKLNGVKFGKLQEKYFTVSTAIELLRACSDF